MPNLLISKKLPDSVLRAAADRYDVTLRDTEASMTEVEVTSALGAYDAILPTLGDQFTGDAIRACDVVRCKVIANFGVGYNHIDVETAKARGIAVSNTPGAVTDATADIAMTLILMTARRAGEGERLVRAGKWTGWQPTQMLGLHVSGKTVGIIGMGRIGQAIAHRCKAGFGCKIVFANRSTKVVNGAQQLASPEDVARIADVVVVATPGGAQTRHLIDRNFLTAMQSHAILVNISRGDVIDEAALVSALQEGQLAGAGLDVYEEEPVVPQALIDMEHVTLLPHLGTAALDVREGMGMMALANVNAFFDGKQPPNLV
ncbi:D-glycerate dehydrogenase [uncultured Litoreibacter sp.]|uniref:2-hydroxyacid dehydrogenase n=1 Tax=uncultured Litoreibacter sp. TaxID=1392394 RepID=UPI002628233E|nr:D-glycerate dehydrogenase [uncultured Litoreibacter sp.]